MLRPTKTVQERDERDERGLGEGPCYGPLPVQSKDKRGSIPLPLTIARPQSQWRKLVEGQVEGGSGGRKVSVRVVFCWCGGASAAMAAKYRDKGLCGLRLALSIMWPALRQWVHSGCRAGAAPAPKRCSMKD